MEKIIIVNVECKMDKIQDFINVTKISQKFTLQEDGCLMYEIFQNNIIPNKFTLFEKYKSEDDFIYHKETEHFQEWRNLTYDMMLTPRISSQNTLL